MATTIVSVGAVTATQLTGLTPGTAYTVRIRARDAAGNVSAWSSTVPATTTAGATTRSISVGAVTAVQATGLVAASSYTARIRAKDSAGNVSAWSATVPFTTAAAGVTPPMLVPGRARPVLRGGSVALDVTATPPGGQTITSHSWAIQGGAGGSLSGAATATPTYTAPASGSGLVTIRDTVTASGGGTAVADLTVSYGATIVAAENALTGTARATWDLASPNLGGVSTLQGFCDGFTVDKSGTASFKIGQSDGAGWSAEVFRLGWYAGNGARSYGTLAPNGTQLTASQAQPAPADVDPDTTRLSADCAGWATTLTWTPPAWAPSGMYVLRLNRTGGGASHVMFVVRDDARAADLMLMPSDSTWNAYNAFGGMGANQYAGNSLYYGVNVDQYNADCAHFVSYNRPVVNRGAADAGRDYGAVEWSTFFTGEYPMVRFVERNGLDVKYYGCIDAGGDATGTHLKGGGGRAAVKAAMFVGHNEYWSDAMRSGWEAARDAGVSVFSCAGNEVFWRTIGTNPDAAGRPRTVECFKSTIGSRASTGRAQWTGTWRDPDGAGKGGGQPENTFTGTIFTVNGPNLKSLVVPFAGGYSAQPIWRNTAVAALTSGQSYTSPSQILGFEWDTYGPAGTDGAGSAFMAAPHPQVRYCSNATYAVTGDLLVDAGDVYGSGNATHRLVAYPAAAGGMVFGTGTVNWALGVDDANTYQQGNDNTSPVIQQATLNLLTDMGAPPTTLMSGMTQPVKTAWFGNVTADAALAITATLTAGAIRSAPAQASIAVTAALAAAATRTASASAALPVTATLTTAAATTRPAAAAVAVTATLLAAAARTAAAGAALSITASLAAAASRATATDAALAITATLTADGTTGAAPITAAAALAVTATLTTAAVRTATGAAALAVTVTLTTAATLSRPAGAGLAVTVTLTAGSAGLPTAGAALAVLATLVAAASAIPPGGRITYRPDTGTTARPNTGVTARP